MQSKTEEMQSKTEDQSLSLSLSSTLCFYFILIQWCFEPLKGVAIIPFSNLEMNPLYSYYSMIEVNCLPSYQVLILVKQQSQQKTKKGKCTT